MDPKHEPENSDIQEPQRLLNRIVTLPTPPPSLLLIVKFPLVVHLKSSALSLSRTLEALTELPILLPQKLATMVPALLLTWLGATTPLNMELKKSLLIPLVSLHEMNRLPSLERRVLVQLECPLILIRNEGSSIANPNIRYTIKRYEKNESRNEIIL